jgi:protein-tyrosine phosphatase
MIDLHLHILPGLDDGSRNMEESLNMARRAVADGIKAVVATPHVMAGVHNNSKEKILDAVQVFRRQLRVHGVPLEVYPGAEYMLDPEIPRWLREGRTLTLYDGGKYLLVEFPAADIPIYAAQTLFEIALQGITPIIAHPERNGKFIGDPDLLLPFIDRGALCQCTAGSYTGLFGSRIQRVALDYLLDGYCYFISSDAHGTGSRSPVLSEAYQVAEGYSAGLGELLMVDNPGRLLQGCAPVRPPVVEKQINKGKLGFLSRLWRKKV